MFLFQGSVTEADLSAMGRSLDHRGPDKFSISVVDNVGFAHNRLSIVDLSPTGDQPFCDERFTLIFNGEIYNHLDLRKDLLARGCFFVGTSDTETLFLCLKTYGVPETLKKIQGMFAFAFHDRVERRLYLCRDRFGIKPLFWIRDSKGLFWASEVKALMLQPGVKLDPLRLIFSVNGSGDQSNKYTVFQDVFHLPPGHYLVVGENACPELNEYHSLSQDIDPAFYRELDSLPAEEVLSRFERILAAAVEKMLMSDVPVGIFVSGGVDSSLIAALAHQHQPGIGLFTSDVIGEYSELPFSRLLASTLGETLHVNPFRPEQFLEDLALATWHYETPIVKFVNAVPFARVADLARQQGVKPVLTGEGSDELFLGYPSIHYSKYQKFLDLPKVLIDRIYSALPLLRSYVEKPQQGPINEFLAKLAAGFERQFLRERGGLEAFHFIPGEQSRMDHYQAVQMMREHLVALLHRNDRMGMQFSIESRFPFLDEELVRFALNLPLKWKVRRVGEVFDRKHPFLMEKAIVRLAARRLLPRKLSDKPKWGFGSYGHNHMQVDPGYFKGGFVADLLKLDAAVVDYLVSTQDPYYVAKLVSLEVFGRLFGWGESPESTRELNLAHLQMVVAQ